MFFPLPPLVISDNLQHSSFQIALNAGGWFDLLGCVSIFWGNLSWLGVVSLSHFVISIETGS